MCRKWSSRAQGSATACNSNDHHSIRPEQLRPGAPFQQSDVGVLVALLGALRVLAEAAPPASPTAVVASICSVGFHLDLSSSDLVSSCLHLSQVRRAALLSCCFLPAVAMGVMPDLICKSCPGLRMPSCIFACPDQIQKDSATKTQLFLPCKGSIIRWKAPLQLLYVLARLAELQCALPACELQRIVKWSSQNHVNCKPS